MTTEIREFEALIDAMHDTERAAQAVFGLREALNCEIDWRGAADAQRQVEAAFLKIFDAVKMRAERNVQ